jgi:outer membrane protein assembly factor BamD
MKLKNIRNEKGITLVALVITIIVLIILAAVSINAVMNEGLITNAKDAKQKISLIEDHLAGHEMSVGRYYLENKEYLSALNRFSTVTDTYQTTAQIEEALYREIEIYTILGLTHEANKKERILTSNYPDSKWSKLAKELISKE